MSARKNTRPLSLSVADIRKAVTQLRKMNREPSRAAEYAILGGIVKTDYSMIDGRTDTYDYYGDF